MSRDKDRFCITKSKEVEKTAILIADLKQNGIIAALHNILFMPPSQDKNLGGFAERIGSLHGRARNQLGCLYYGLLKSNVNTALHNQ